MIFRTVTLIACLLVGSFASAMETTPPPQTGKAAYYSDKLHGRPTASGELYDKNALTAAHPTLPFGTQVRVTRLDTGANVVVRIIDRGPWRRKRLIDVSRAAAEQLDMIAAGVVRVKLEVLAQTALNPASVSP